jgi:predicted nucleic acid-binding protein
LTDWFEGRICAIDSETMLCWAHIKATSRTLPVIDSLIVATAIAQGATLVTRNVKDFDGIEGIVTVNPFEES